jgi:hypothetical protein
MKTRTEQHAARAGRPSCWSWGDTEAARAEANATARPHGPNGPTPEEAWSARRPISNEQRTCFVQTAERQRKDARIEAGFPSEGPLDDRDTRMLDRVAIRRALEEHDLLLYSRRRIPLPFPKRKTADIR